MLVLCCAAVSHGVCVATVTTTTFVGANAFGYLTPNVAVTISFTGAALTISDIILHYTENSGGFLTSTTGTDAVLCVYRTLMYVVSACVGQAAMASSFDPVR